MKSVRLNVFSNRGSRIEIQLIINKRHPSLQLLGVPSNHRHHHKEIVPGKKRRRRRELEAKHIDTRLPWKLHKWGMSGCPMSNIRGVTYTETGTQTIVILILESSRDINNSQCRGQSTLTRVWRCGRKHEVKVYQYSQGQHLSDLKRPGIVASDVYCSLDRSSPDVGQVLMYTLDLGPVCDSPPIHAVTRGNDLVRRKMSTL